MFSDPVNITCDVCVLGRGLIGSAAAKYLSVMISSSVVLMGPNESIARENDICGAHHVEGRITRKTDANSIWALLAQRSIERYRKIEQESGVHFYHEVGHLVVGSKGEEHMRKVAANAEELGILVNTIDDQNLAANYPFMNFPSNCEGISETTDSGWVSARRQVDAQMAIAKKYGCKEILVPAKAVEPCDIITLDGEEISGFKVYGHDGSIVCSKKVLIATGSNCNLLLPAHLQLDLHIRTAQTLKLKMTDIDTARLADMPTIIYKVGPADYNWCYLLPPILYPDGYYWFKIGGGRKISLEIHTDVVHWYQRNNWSTILSKQYQFNERDMLSVLNELFPGLCSRAVEVKGDTCVTVHTRNNLPYIGQVTSIPCLFVATGGNGFAAKSADEIGRLAAMSVINEKGKWGDQELSSTTFLPVLKQQSKH